MSKNAGIIKESIELGADRVYNVPIGYSTYMHATKDKQRIVFLMFVPHFSLLVA